MKKILLVWLILLTSVLAQGVGVLDASAGVYLRMDSTSVSVTVESQISTTVTTQYFTNINSLEVVKFAYPMGEQSSAVKLRWKVGNQWYTASIANKGQDTTLPGGSTPNYYLTTYLGKTPLYYSIPQKIKTDSTLVVELTYVELLPYAFGNVNYICSNDYHLIQSGNIPLQKFDFLLSSLRSIDSIFVLSKQPITVLINNGKSASIKIIQKNKPANENYSIQYSLNANQLGLFSYSALFPASEIPDPFGGFFTFIAEPDPGQSMSTIPKVFTLVIDRSGSMSGTKISQAHDAASYIIKNLNSGDKFNIVGFTDDAVTFRNQPVEFTSQNRDAALTFISSLDATNGTNIGNAFDVAVSQFSNTDNSTANIIIFLTDGQPTSGITSIDLLVNHIDTSIKTLNKSLQIFCFGIGGDANQQLLALLSSHNNGLAYYLGNNEFYSSITNFYMTIRNPVLLNSHITFEPNIISEVYPDSLPNLYKGQQMIVSGRYNQSGTVKIKLSGTAFGKQVNYSYNVDLEDKAIDDYRFLPKVWAKKKIESLLLKYYTLSPLTEEAKTIKATIIEISKGYNIVTEFTSFTNPVTGIKEDHAIADKKLPAEIKLVGNYPNPFNPSTKIRFNLDRNSAGQVKLIKIYNILGQLVAVIDITSMSAGINEVLFNGKDMYGKNLPSGIYFVQLQVGGKIYGTIKINMLK